MKTGRSMKKAWALMAVASMAWMAVACSSGPEEEDPAMNEVLGSPPSEDSPDYEFALPEMYGEGHSERSPAGQPAAGYPHTEAVQKEQIDRLKGYGPSIVLTHVQVEPKHDDGFVGFEIVEISETARPYLEHKLEEGDVVTHINLVRLEMPDDYLEAWEVLSKTEEIRIDFRRDEESKTATWKVE